MQRHVRMPLAYSHVAGFPSAAMFPAIVAPTGDDDRGLGTGHTHAFLPLWLGKAFGRLGGVYDISDAHHILISAGRGLRNVSETNEVSTYIAYQLTF